MKWIKQIYSTRPVTLSTFSGKEKSKQILRHDISLLRPILQNQKSKMMFYNYPVYYMYLILDIYD